MSFYLYRNTIIIQPRSHHNILLIDLVHAMKYVSIIFLCIFSEGISMILYTNTANYISHVTIMQCAYVNIHD